MIQIQESYFHALLMINTLALELAKTEFIPVEPCEILVKDTVCCFHAGQFMRSIEPKQNITLPIHLVYTGPYAALSHALEDEILLDFCFHTDILMIIETKQAFLISKDESCFVLRIEDPLLFQQLKDLIPLQLQDTAICLYQQSVGKENANHVQD